MQRGAGCDECRGYGYPGRTAIHEILVLDDDLRHLVMERSSGAAIRNLALDKGMQPLRKGGWEKVKQGSPPPMKCCG